MRQQQEASERIAFLAAYYPGTIEYVMRARVFRRSKIA